MILVVLGTQDKPFRRLIEDVEKEIELGHIKEEVIVQAGQTTYESKRMKVLSLIPAPEFEKLIEDASLIITHGGAGTILSAIKKGKKIIACARLSKYKEHHNDHQKQIISEFSEMGYLLEYCDGDNLYDLIKKSKNFKPKKFKSNTKNMINLIDNYIVESNNISWYHKYKEVLLYLFFGGCTTLVNIVSFILLRLFKINMYFSNGIAWFLSVVFAFFTNKIFVFESKNSSFSRNIYEMVSFFLFRLLSLVFDMGFMFLMIDVIGCGELISKIISNIFVIIINYLFSKLIIFKKGN